MPTTLLKNVMYRAVLPLAAPGCGRRPVSSVTGHELYDRRGLETLLRRHHVLGSATLLSNGNHTSIICSSSEKPFHHAEPDTFFRVASITKTATTVVCLHLADQGILSLDCPAGQYFSDSSAASALEGITLRCLLSHTSGLVDPPALESYVTASVPFTKLLSGARKHPPGSVFLYSNLGFGLIGCILESVFNRSVGEIFRDELFSPLGMNATLEGCLLPPEKIMPVTRVLPFRSGTDVILTQLGSRPLASPDPLCHYGHTAGSMYTDINSLFTLFRILINRDDPFLSPGTKNEMTSRQASYGSLSPTLSYGLGLLIINDPSLSAGRILGHQGFAYGCADGAFWEENTGRTVITLNGGCSEARTGRLGLSNRDMIRWAFRKELAAW